MGLFGTKTGVWKAPISQKHRENQSDEVLAIRILEHFIDEKDQQNLLLMKIELEILLNEIEKELKWSA